MPQLVQAAEIPPCPNPFAGRTFLPAAPHSDAVRQILRRCAAQVGLRISGLERLSPDRLRAGSITKACRQGARDEEIMDHTRYRGLRPACGYVRRAKLLIERLVNQLGL